MTWAGAVFIQKYFNFSYQLLEEKMCFYGRHGRNVIEDNTAITENNKKHFLKKWQLRWGGGVKEKVVGKY